MSLNFDTIDNLVAPPKLFILLEIALFLIAALTLIVILWKNWILEFKVSAIELKVDQLVDKLTNSFTIPWPQCLNLDVLNIGQPKFLQVIDHFGKSIINFPLEVTKIYEYALFFILNTKDKT